MQALGKSEILIVGSGQAVCAGLKRMVEKLGDAAIIARDAVIARRRCEAKDFNLVLLNCWRSDNAGLSLIDQIKIVCPHTALIASADLNRVVQRLRPWRLVPASAWQGLWIVRP